MISALGINKLLVILYKIKQSNLVNTHTYMYVCIYIYIYTLIIGLPAKDSVFLALLLVS